MSYTCVFSQMARLTTCVAFALSLSSAWAADPYPTKPIRLLNGFTAGGGTDTLARTLAQGLSEVLGQSIVVDNKPGANGHIATLELQKAAPDGYTLMAAISSFVTNPLLKKSMSYDPVKDFTPIAVIASVPYVLVASPTLGVKDVAGLLRLAKTSPGTLTFGSSGTGSPQHLFAEMMNGMAGVKVIEVPYKGGSQLMPDLLTGRLSMSWFSTVIAMPYLQDKRLHALAVSTRDRVKSLPDVPPLTEAGVPGFHADQFTAIVGPPGMSPAIVMQLQDAIVKVVSSSEMQAKFRAQGAEPRPGTAADLTRLLNEEVAKWDKVIRDAGIMKD